MPRSSTLCPRWNKNPAGLSKNKSRPNRFAEKPQIAHKHGDRNRDRTLGVRGLSCGQACDFSSWLVVSRRLGLSREAYGGCRLPGPANAGIATYAHSGAPLSQAATLTKAHGLFLHRAKDRGLRK